MFCDYEVGTTNEHLKENLIVNAYSSKIHKKLYSMTTDTSLNAIIVQMETLEQAACESKLCEMAIGKTHSSVGEGIQFLRIPIWITVLYMVSRRLVTWA